MHRIIAGGVDLFFTLCLKHRFCKGADNIILERVKDDAARLAQLQHFVTIFAEEGLRTLVLATRHLSPEVFAEWKSLQRIAAATPAGPAKKDASAKAAALVESVRWCFQVAPSLTFHLVDVCTSLAENFCVMMICRIRLAVAGVWDLGVASRGSHCYRGQVAGQCS